MLRGLEWVLEVIEGDPALSLDDVVYLIRCKIEELKS